MKEEYIKPVIVLEAFNQVDVLTASSDDVVDPPWGGEVVPFG